MENNSSTETTDLKAYLDEKMDKARAALKVLETYTQEQADALVKACAKAVFDNAEELARDAVDETGMGLYEDKVAKNRNKAMIIWWSLQDKKSVGIIDTDEATGITKIAKPVGVVGAVTPTTNPIVTCMSNAMFALKCRNPIVFAPHPRAVMCCIKTVDYMNERLKALGAPDGCIQILDIKSIELTKMLMSASDVVIATGGMDMVRSVYSSGKPALGVGSGNVQVLVDNDVDFKEALPKILTGRAFDNGIICSAEQSAHFLKENRDEALAVFGDTAFVVPVEKRAALREFLFPNGAMNRDMVGQSAQTIGNACGLDVPEGKRVLVVEAESHDDILGEEKMFPVLSIYFHDSWQDAIENARENLERIGKGHSIAIHSNNQAHIEEAAIKCAVSRVVCNQISATSAGGSFQNGLSPTNTLGCGSWGNNSISENLTYYHLMNITRVAKLMSDKPILTSDQIW